MRNMVAAIVLAGVLMASGGCCLCRSEVPVSLENVYNLSLFHGPGCRQYPYSCPRCLYYDSESCAWHKPPCAQRAAYESEPHRGVNAEIPTYESKEQGQSARAAIRN